MPTPPLNILIIQDNKPGHLSQLDGLEFALSGKNEAVFKHLEVAASANTENTGFIPNMVIGAGHTTHTTVLKLARKHRAFSVVLMKPSLPSRFFNAIICPSHDKLKASHRVFKTRGTINKVRPNIEKAITRRHHLILLGGPSKHYQWNEESLLDQIEALSKHSTNTLWEIIPSRRTPETICQLITDKISATKISSMRFLSQAEISHVSLQELMQTSKMTWVTPDSQSMIYESITAGSPTAIFDMKANPRKKSARIQEQLAKLSDDNMLIHFGQWQLQQSSLNELYYAPAPTYFCEADEAADWLLERYRQKTTLNELSGHKPR